MNPEQTILETQSLAERQESLVARVTDAHKALQIASTSYKAAWSEWQAMSNAMLPEVRMWRMAMDSELANSLKHFADVRQFFLSDKHDQEIARLKEFVELCERLKALKESGFLDKISDTVLKLEVGK